MRPFVHDVLATRVVFGRGSYAEQVAPEVDRLGLRRVLIVASGSTRAHVELAQSLLGDRVVAVDAGAVMHVPVAVAQRGVRLVDDARADGCLAIGGGSAVGLAKAIARERPLPTIAVPTTYSGSEMTPIWGLTDGDVKTTGRDRGVAPATVIYDPLLSTTLPLGTTVTSALNAMAHAVEALYAPDGTPLISVLAAEGIRALATALPQLAARPGDAEARERALYGAWLCGTCLGNASMSLHHKLCHVLGGTLNLPHAETHAVVLPYAFAYNAPAAPEAAATVAHALGTANGAVGLRSLAVELGAPSSLRQLGMTADGIDRAVELAVANPYANPRPVTSQGIRELLVHALDGLRPHTLPGDAASCAWPSRPTAASAAA